MQAKEFNPQVFLEFLCYSFFAGTIVYLTASGKYLQYVTPRMAGYLYFSAAVLLIWAASGLRRMFRPQYRVRFLHCFVLVIPLALLLIPQRPLSASDLASRYSSSTTFSSTVLQTQPDLSAPAAGFVAATVVPTAAATQAEFSAQDSSGASPTQELKVMSVGTPLLNDSSANATGASAMINGVAVNLSNLPGLDVENKRITIDNDAFYAWVMEIYLHKYEYEGFQVSMTGFVFKNAKAMEADEFVPARLVMSCCAADLMPSGLLSKYEKADDLEVDSWVTVEGTIELYKFRTFDDVRVQVATVTPAEEVKGYIYPF